MIIELAEAFGKYNEQQWVDYHVAIENLISAHRSGWHLFSPSRRCAESLSAGCQLSFSQKEVFDSYIQPKITTMSGQARSSDHTLLCIPDTEECKSERPNQIVVPLSVFADSRMVLPFQLITENADSDGATFEMISKAVARFLGYNMPTYMDHVTGGGGTTGSCYAKALKENRPTLCIVDSDQRFPSGPFGSTARSVLSHGKSNEFGTVQAIVLPVRETENLMPISFLLQVYSGNATVANVISRFHEFRGLTFTNSSSQRVLSFLDLKLGETEGKIAKIPDDFKEDIVKACGKIFPSSKTLKFINEHSNENALPAVSFNLLKNTVEYIHKNKHQENLLAKKIMAAPFWSSIEGPIRKILSFSMAGARLPV